MHQTVLWAIFSIFVVFMIYLDLFVYHRKARVVLVKESLIWSAAWVVLTLIFNMWLYYYAGSEKALNFFTGYLIERSLSIDNLFVFLIIFNYFKVPHHHQHNVLFWGIIGALVIRGVFIVMGVALVEKFHWMIYLFGIFLIYTGIKMVTEKDIKIEPDKNPVVRLFRKFFPVTADYVDEKYFVKRHGRHWATPMFVTLLVVAVTDVVFAVDSIPAILAITRDPFIVYSSNVFAVLGLRAFYFALAAIMDMFCYLSYGLAIILVFIGGKMLLQDLIHIQVGVTLGVVSVILFVSIFYSIIRPSKRKSP